MKKRWLAVTSLFALAILVGCGQATPTPDTPDDDTSDVTDDEQEKHSIKIGETNGVEISLDKTSATSGEKVTITITNVPQGKTIDEISLGVEGVTVTETSSTSYYFTMPKVDVTITISTKDVPLDYYKLTIDNKVGAEIVTLMNNQQDEMVLEDGAYNLAPNTSYMLRLNYSGACAVRLNGETIAQTEGYYMFYMPPMNSVLTIEETTSPAFSVKYDNTAISELFIMDSSTFAEISASHINEGTEIYVEATLNHGYLISQVLANGEEIDFDGGNGFYFTMPNYDVEIEIVTEKDPNAGYLISTDYTYGDGLKVTYGSAVNSDGSLVPFDNFNEYTTSFKAGTKVYFHVEIMKLYVTMYEIDSVEVNGTPVTLDENNNASFVFGDSNVVVTPKNKLIQYDLTFDDEGTGATCVFTNEDGDVITTAGRTQYVTATFTNPDSTMAVSKVYLNGEEGTGTLEGNTYTFMLTIAEDTEITVDWMKLTPHNLTFKSNIASLDSTIYVDFYSEESLKQYTPITTATAGETIYVKIDNYGDYSIESVNLNDSTLETTTVNGMSYYTFTMPNEDVELEITFTEVTNKHTVTTDTSNISGNVELLILDETASQQLPISDCKFAPGETVYVSAWVQSGTIDAVLANEIKCDQVDSSGIYSFTMPDEDVVIKIQLKA